MNYLFSKQHIKPNATKHKREAQIAIIAIPPVDALVVTAAARGASSPSGGDQGLPRKLCSFRIDYGRCGDGEWRPPLEKQPIPAAMFCHVVSQHCCRNGT